MTPIWKITKQTKYADDLPVGEEKVHFLCLEPQGSILNVNAQITCTSEGIEEYSPPNWWISLYPTGHGSSKSTQGTLEEAKKVAVAMLQEHVKKLQEDITSITQNLKEII